MKLYDIPLKSKIYAKTSYGSKYIIYDHPDGMYGYCIAENGEVCFLAMAEELKEYKDGYKLK